MSIATLTCRGIGPDATPNSLVLRGLAPAPAVPTGGGLVTRGLGLTPSSMILRGFSLVAPTQQVVPCTATTWTGYSLQENQSPAVVVGDIFYADLVTRPGGYPFTVNGDGTVSIDAHSDLSRQFFDADIWDTSAGGWYGQFRVYFNNHAPQIVAQPPNIRALTNTQVGLDFTPSDPNATQYIIDQDGDPITSALQSGALPTGLALAGNQISGVATAPIANDVVVRFTDVLGESIDVALNVFADVGKVVPPMVGLTLNAASAALTGAGLVIDPVVNFQQSISVPAGRVIAQQPDSGGVVFSDALITLFVSLGDGTGDTGDGGAGNESPLNFYGVNADLGDYRVLESTSLPQTAVYLALQYAVYSADKRRVLDCLKALEYYILFDTWPPV